MQRTAAIFLIAVLISSAGAARAQHDPATAGHQHDPAAAGHQHDPDEAHGQPGPETAADPTALRHEGRASHSFADAEAWAERFESPRRDAWQMPDRVVAALAVEPAATVADIGSGTGYFARRFAAAVGPAGTVYAADVEPEMAVYVRRRADEEGQRNLVPVLASYDDPRLPDGSIDLVFIANTWHHIGDRVEYARRLAGDLRAGGRVAILDFLPGELPVGPGPEHKLSAEEVTAELTAAGYRPVAAHDFLPYQYVLVFE